MRTKRVASVTVPEVDSHDPAGLWKSWIELIVPIEHVRACQFRIQPGATAYDDLGVDSRIAGQCEQNTRIVLSGAVRLVIQAADDVQLPNRAVDDRSEDLVIGRIQQAGWSCPRHWRDADTNSRIVPGSTALPGSATRPSKPEFRHVADVLQLKQIRLQEERLDQIIDGRVVRRQRHAAIS